MMRDLIRLKKGQGLSLTTIIIAIIVLVVLVVLIMIFSGFFANIFSPGVTDCASKGGVCTDEQCDNKIQGAATEACQTAHDSSFVCCLTAVPGFGD